MNRHRPEHPSSGTPRPGLALSGVSTLLLLLALAVPTGASAQLGIAARAGTLGIGGEAALGLSDRLVVRGGLGVTNLEVSTTLDGVDVELQLPESWYNVGLDLYLNGALRVGGGLLFKPDDPQLLGVLTEPVDIGGRTFTPSEIGTLTGRIVSDDQAPYVLVGFGKHTDSGFGLSLDIGAAFTGDPRVTLDAQGGTFSDRAELEARLDQEARNFEEDMKTYLRIWPILSLGLRLGLG
ncbi:MAG: hypothetical protein R3253_01855 [Longimicrobiales bacterium]|nr:hypothetical protein [Longimicrobiales bacterium]